MRSKIGFLLLAILLPAAYATIASAAGPSTQPNIDYNKATDRTIVTVNLGAVNIVYGYGGKDQKSYVDEFTLFATAAPREAPLTFLVNDEKKIPLELGSSLTTKITSDWLAQFVDARSVGVNIGTTAGGTPLTPPQIQSIKSFLTVAGYYSLAKQKTTAPFLMWQPDNNVVYIMNTRGSMMETFDSQIDKITFVLHHPNPNAKMMIIGAGEGAKAPLALTMEPKTEETCAKLADWLSDVHARGSGNIPSAFATAVRMKPDAIVFLTGHDAEDGDVRRVKAILAESGIPLHVFVVGAKDNPKYRELAEASKGMYVVEKK